jgi:parvulin-like peptidyl-prolyl isomerase
MKRTKRVWQTVAAVAALALLAGTAGAQGSKPAALVNGEPIAAAEVEGILRLQPQSPTPLTEAQKRQAQKDALDFLINELVMRQFLQQYFKGKPPIPAAQINQHLAELVADLKKKNLTLEHFLKDCGQTEAQLRANIVKELMWEAYVKERVTDADLQKYYAEYKPFFDRVVVHASHILIRLGENAKPEEKQAARQKLADLRKEIVAGKVDFAEAAKKYSDCPTKVNGGDLGFFPRKFVVLEPFAQAAFAMKVGDVSDVVETDYGMHLIKVHERSQGEPSEFGKIKDEVRKIYMMELGMTLLNQERTKAKIVTY